ncbi:hypothetical protein BDZ89DRAFT_1079944 [Hymenopellis radicata]|nr:hypothetical protein BDZ89DRAFT_1079944 [Hymenopellis radicata]
MALRTGTLFPPTTILSDLARDSTSNSLPSAPFSPTFWMLWLVVCFQSPTSRFHGLRDSRPSSSADFISTWTPLSFTTPWDDVRGHAPPRPALLNGFALLLVVLWSASRYGV